MLQQLRDLFSSAGLRSLADWFTDNWYIPVSIVVVFIVLMVSLKFHCDVTTGVQAVYSHVLYVNVSQVLLVKFGAPKKRSDKKKKKKDDKKDKKEDAAAPVNKKRPPPRKTSKF